MTVYIQIIKGVEGARFEIAHLNNKAFKGNETPSYWLSDDGDTLYIGIVKRMVLTNYTEAFWKQQVITIAIGPHL